MTKTFRRWGSGGYFRWCLAAIVIFMLGASATPAQKNKKNTKDTDDASQSSGPSTPLPVADEIDGDIGQMLAGFQLGDIEMMHKYYAENVTFVSGAYEPPVVGWQNYAPLYKRQMGGFQGMQLIRRNTLIMPHGDVAWASYQWELLSLYNGQPYTAHGQTTLVFTKIGQNWLIVHNHTSEICPSSQQPTGQQSIPAPGASAATPVAPRS